MMKQQSTATIYQFPTRTRATSASRASVMPNTQQTAPHQFPAVEFGRGWYHEAAIADADKDYDLSHQQH